MTSLLYLQCTMWPWQSQQPTSSTHPHYPPSSLTYHHPQSHNVTSPHAHTLPPGVVHPQTQFPAAGGQHYIYPSSTPTGEFSTYPPHPIANQVPVDGWPDQRQNSVQSESVALPFSAQLQSRSDVHIASPVPTLQTPPIHPTQQATPTNIQQPQQQSPLPLTPSHPPQSHTHPVTGSPFSMDFILREHTPATHDGVELTQPVVQYAQGAGPAQGDLHDPVAPGYQSGMGDVMYQAPQSHPHSSHPPLSHPHTTPSPQLQPGMTQGYAEGGGVEQVTFDPNTHYGDQAKTGLPVFVPVAETGERVGSRFPSSVSPIPEAVPFSDNLQSFQLHSNYPPAVTVAGAGEMEMEMEPQVNEAPYSPPELIPEHAADDQSDGLNQSHDCSVQSTECARQVMTPPGMPAHGGPSPGVDEEPNLTNREPELTSTSPAYDAQEYLGPSPGVDGVQTTSAEYTQNQSQKTSVEQNSTIQVSLSPHLDSSPINSPGSDALLIDVAESPEKNTESETERQTVAVVVPPSHLPIRKSKSPPGDDFDVRPSAPKPPPLIRRVRNCSSDEEDDVFLPSSPRHHPPTITPSQHTSPTSPPSQSHIPSSPPSYVPPPTTSSSSPPPPQPSSTSQSQSHSSPPSHSHTDHNSDTEEDEAVKMETTTPTPSKTTPTNYQSSFFCILVSSLHVHCMSSLVAQQRQQQALEY